MTEAEFTAYRSKFRTAIRSVLAASQQGRLDEAAFPAYSHPNPLINWLFWKRLHLTMNYVERGGTYEKVLDFGCGSGVLLPFLAQRSHDVVAADIDIEPLGLMRESLGLPENVRTLDLAASSLDTLPENSFDMITALDVLEHVKDLPGTLDRLMRLLRPGGKLLISGPTEEVFYKMGRMLAGKEYSGNYHERGIAEIRRELTKRATIDNIAVLFWPVRLFDIFAGKK